MRFGWPLLWVLVPACSSSSAGPVSSTDDELRSEKVDAIRSVPLPIAEVSGLGERRVGGKSSYAAIGDSSAKIVTFTIEEGCRVSDLETHDLSAIFQGAPQWEAVAGDGDGRWFLLGEASSTISVLDRDLHRVTNTIKLVIPRGHALERAWAAEANSRGEGMVLLANGHVIVAKEKEPSALVEFGPSTETAEGFRAELALGDRPFPLPAAGEIELVALTHWLIDGKQAKAIGDISDLAIDAEKRLVLLSDQGRAIARVENGLRPDESKVGIERVFALPRSVDKPEGLAFANGRPIVATDSQDVEGESLHEIEPLP